MRDLVLSKQLEVLFILSQEYMVYALIKPLPEVRFTSLKTKLIVVPQAI